MLNGNDGCIAALGPSGAVDGVQPTGYVRLIKACEPLDVRKRMRIVAILGREGEYGPDLSDAKTWNNR